MGCCCCRSCKTGHAGGRCGGADGRGSCCRTARHADGGPRPPPSPRLAGPPDLPKYVADPIPIYTVGLGPFTKKISTANPEAQALFDQGMQMMYSFAKLDAVRSFRAAWARDPECAICHWGEGWAWGSYLNGPMLAEHSPFAYAAAKKALALKANAKLKWEQAFIDALQTRYVEHFEAKNRMDQERAYADAMKKVSEALPDDLDAMTLYGDALFLLEPRRGTRDLNDPEHQAAARRARERAGA